jgi:hypothetical protein
MHGMSATLRHRARRSNRSLYLRCRGGRCNLGHGCCALAVAEHTPADRVAVARRWPCGGYVSSESYGSASRTTWADHWAVDIEQAARLTIQRALARVPLTHQFGQDGLVALYRIVDDIMEAIPWKAGWGKSSRASTRTANQ